ncbi:MAG: pantoate--beta-alanine ligase [Pseudomonadota bacterium]
MQVIQSLEALRAVLADYRDAGDRTALVPTMGNLHRGHLALAEQATRLADHTVVSIFVNPTQFAEGEDYKTYPRTLDKDTLVLKRSGVDIIFAPSVSEVYPFGQSAATRIHVPEIGDDLCGRHRAGHFDGVASVVCRLLFMVQPHVAVFGEKDYQQLQLLKRLVSDLSIPTQIESAPTVRESDGLAMSSRNQYLSEAERGIAPELHATLQAAATMLAAGEADFDRVEQRAIERLEEAGFKTDYVAVRDAATLTPPLAASEAFVVLAAGWLGSARLIDNVVQPNPRFAD